MGGNQMKRLLAATALFVALAAPNSMANPQLQSWCEGFAAANGVPPAPCTCIVNAIGTNADLSAEMMTFRTIAEYHDNGSAALQALVDPCVPPRRE